MAVKRSKLTIRDRKTRRGKELEKLNGKKLTIKVGIFDPKLAQIGSYHEFGTRNIPRRSFLRDFTITKQGQIIASLRKAMESVYNGKPPFAALDQLGQMSVEGIRTRILKKIPPRLAASTIERKQGAYKTVPLIDRGLLFRSITFRIEEED